MAANRTWCAEFPFQTRLTTLATDTTLGTAAEHDFADVDVRLPENVVIRSAYVQLDFADSFAAAADIDNVRGGIQIDAVAFSDTDLTLAQVDTGDHTRWSGVFDVTSYFQTNFPTDGLGANVGFRVRVATETAQNINGIAAKLVVVYAFDKADSIFYPDDGEQEVVGGFVKTVRIPIHSHHTSIGTTYVEIGTTGGIFDAPVNQIPNLSTLLTDIVGGSADLALAIWFEGEAQSLGAGTDLTMTMRFDGATDVPRYTVENSALSTNVTYFDRVTLGGISLPAVDFTMATNAAHALEAKSDSATTFERLGGFLCVTYVVDPAATVAFNSVTVPVVNGNTSISVPYYSERETAGVIDCFNADIMIQEPGPIVMRQSAVCLHGQMNNMTKYVQFPGTMQRSFVAASSAVRDGAAYTVVRFDHCNPTDTIPSFPTIDLTRGPNRIPVFVGASVVSTNSTPMGGYAVINYHSGVAVDPADDSASPHSHARTLDFVIAGYTEFVANTRITMSPTAPTIVDDYTLIGATVDYVEYVSIPGTSVLAARRIANEGSGDGNERISTTVPTNMSERGVKRTFMTTSAWWRTNQRSSEGIDFQESNQMDIEATRGWTHISSAAGGYSAIHRVAIHSITYDLSGTYEVDGVGVTGDGVGPSGGYGVDVSWRDAGGTRGGHLRRNIPVTAGAWSTKIYDDTVVYHVTGRNGLNGNDQAGWSGYVNRQKDAPRIVSVGTYSTSTTSFTMAAGEHRFGDIVLVFVESTNGNAVATPTDYTEVTDSPQEATATRLTVFARQITDEADQFNQDPGPTIAGFTNHASGCFVVIRGANVDDLFLGGDVASALSFLDVTEGGTATTNTAHTITGDTTTEDMCLVLVALTHENDTVASTDQALNTWANANLDGLRGIVGNGSSSGDGGGMSIARGIKKTAGAVGNTTVTMSNTTSTGKIMIAIKPQSWPTDTILLESNSGGGGGTVSPIGSPLVRRIA